MAWAGATRWGAGTGGGGGVALACTTSKSSWPRPLLAAALPTSRDASAGSAHMQVGRAVLWVKASYLCSWGTPASSHGNPEVWGIGANK